MVRALFLCPDRWGVCRGELPPPIPSGVELHPCEQDPSADSCRSFCQTRSSPQQAVLLEFLHQPVIDVLPAQRQRTRSRKGKGVAFENVSGNPPLPEQNPSFSPGERSGTSEVPLPNDFFADLAPGFTTHESLYDESRRKVVAEGSSLINEDEGVQWVFNAALDGSFRESRISHFKAEEAERELFRFQKEVEEQSRRQAELHSRDLVCAERRGKRAIVAEMKRKAALFATEFGCYPLQVAERGLLFSCRGRVRQLWDSIEVSEDTVKAGTGVGDEGAGVADGEVDQPTSSFGVSMSGTGFRARPRFTFGSKAVRRLIGSRFACGRFPPGSFRFKVRDLAPAYMTCMERTEHSPETVWSADQNFGFLGMRVFNAALDGSFRESRISHFKAEEAERELFRFQKEVEEQSRRQAELHSRALVRAEGRGKRAIVAEMKRMAALFATEFESFKDAQKFVAEMSGLMNGCAHAESLVPPIEGRVRELWDSIEVSEDTAEAGTGVGDECAGVADGEVDQPVSSFGISMSGFLDFEL
ncbi:hypothetical protein F2Q68_00020670 [Brassica cretica]|uniref:Uncharacterized protein n=1 Tax=Brassica cretica TaxID=69181 RepID=A0A8S9FUI9_BRACR|nr:hypothetical protein F2Q68_00020670 [Brassica cretica]